jgi:hypothetical protein
MCSFDTSEDDIDAFVAGIREELHRALIRRARGVPYGPAEAGQGASP